MGSHLSHRRMLCALEPRIARMGSDGRVLMIRDYPLDPRLIHQQFMEVGTRSTGSTSA